MNEVFTKMGTNIYKTAGRFGIKVQKYSPEILVTIGVVGVIGTVVVACKSTLKAQDILDEHESNMQTVKDAADLNEEYRENDMKREAAMVYAITAKEFAKLYAPALGLGAFSIGCILAGNNILRKRNFALIAAYNTVSDMFNRYRKNVIDELGEEADGRFRAGKKAKKILVKQIDEKTGKEKEINKKVDVASVPGDISEYGRWFVKGNTTQYDNHPFYNISYVKSQETYFNNLLQTRGHVFLSEVYDALGFERTPASIVVGWVKGNGDDYIDFGIIDNAYIECDEYNTAKVDSKSSIYEDGFFVDFNVDGVIFDKI